MGLFGFGDSTSSRGVTLLASSVWGLEQEKAPQQVQAAGQAALLHGPYYSADKMVLEVPVTDRDAGWSLWQTPGSESQRSPLVFWSQAQSPSVENYSPLERQSFDCYWALVENEHYNRLPSTMQLSCVP